MSNKDVTRMYNQFLSGDIHKIREEYGEFRKKAILNKMLYTELYDVLKRIENELFRFNDKWKWYMYNCLKSLVTIYENQTITEKEKKNEDLITAIYSTIVDAEQNLTEVSDAHLYLMLDIIWAYSDRDENKLQFSAIIYDITNRMKQSSFYRGACNNIVQHTFHIIQMICQEQNCKPMQYIQAICDQSNQEFVKEFSEKLKELALENSHVEENLDENMPKNSLKETNNRNNGLGLKIGIVCSIIVALIVGFVAGRFINPFKAQLEEKENEVWKLSRELEEYEKKEKEQREQIAELKKELFTLNNNTQETENNEPETETDSELENDTQSGHIKVDIQDTQSQETENDSQTEDSQQENDSQETDPQETDSQTYTLPKERNVRSEKNLTNNENILDVLNVGTIVTVLEAEDADGWMYIQYENADGTTKKGYIYVK